MNPPMRAGWTFTGWFDAATGGHQILSTDTVSSATSRRIFAQWTRNTQDVTFNANGGAFSLGETTLARRINRGLTTDIYAQAFNASDDLVTPSRSRPTRTGWTFTGWFDAAVGGNRVLSTATVTNTGSRTLFAQWERNTQEVIFDANGGTWPAGTVGSPRRHINRGLTTDRYSQAFDVNNYLVNPAMAPPMRAGWTFTGWFDAATGGHQIPSTDTVSNATSRRIFAQWERNTQEVIFDANGGAWPAGTIGSPRRHINRGLAADIYNQAFDVSDDLVTPALNRPTRTGWTFAGWFDAAVGGNRILNTTTVSDTSTRTLHAHWAPVRSVRFNQNRDGVYLFSRFDSLTDAHLRNDVNATFYDVRRGNGSDRRFDQVIGSDGTVPTRAGHVFSNLRDGRLEPSGGSAHLTTANRYFLINQTQPNAVFGGWFDTVGHADAHASANGRISPHMQVPDPAPDEAMQLHVYARWYPTRTVRFAAGPGATWPGGSGTVVTSVAEGATITRRTSTVPTATDGSFLGHITEEQASTLAQVLHATGHRVRAGVCVNDVDRPDVVPTRPGYIFGGWQTEPDGEGASVWYATTLESFNEVEEPVIFPITRNMAATEPITLHALWLPDTLEVTFDANGGTWGEGIESPMRKISHGQETDRFAQAFDEAGHLVNPARNHPTRDGRSFAGWFTMPTGGTRVVSDDRVLSAGTRTLFAQWYTTITWNANGGSGLEENTWQRRAGAELGSLQVPTRADYTFVGWFTEQTGGSQVLSSTRVPNADHTTYWARWRPGDTVTLTFNANGGAPSEEIVTLRAGSTMVELPPEPERDGYEFDGWFTTSGSTGGERVVASNGGTAGTTVPNSNTMYWARWVPNNLVPLTLNHNDGATLETSYTSTIYRAPGSVIGTLPTPRKHGNIFIGWFTVPEPTGGTRITSNDVVPNAEETIYFARWEPRYVLAVSAQNTSAMVGGYANVEVRLDGNPEPGINGLRIYLEFDPNVLAPVVPPSGQHSLFGQPVIDVRPSGFNMPASPTVDQVVPSPADNDRQVFPLIFETVSMENFTDTGPLATVLFHVLGSAVPGTVTEVRPINVVASQATRERSDGVTVTINTDIDADSTVGVVTITVNRAALQTALNAADQRTEANYTPESWAVFTAAQAAAQEVYNNSSATQSEIDAATTALNDAMAALVEASILWGDVNNDDAVTLGDVSLLNLYVLEFPVLDRWMYRGDVNHDGYITLGDVSLLNLYVLGFPVRITPPETTAVAAQSRLSPFAFSWHNPTAQVSMSDVPTAPEGYMDIQIRLDENPGLMGLQLELEFDPAVLEPLTEPHPEFGAVVSVTEGTVMDLPILPAVQAGRTILGFGTSPSFALTNSYETGALATLRFRVLDDAMVDASAITLTGVVALNTALAELPLVVGQPWHNILTRGNTVLNTMGGE